MSDGTKIQWSDATWNPVTGCRVVSPGCTNCYAMKLAGSRLQHHPSRAGLTQPSAAGPVWNGTTRFNAEWLLQPLRWKRPRRIFVVAHGDLFYEGVPDAVIDQVFAVMALAPQHTFQVLTKRPARMREWFEGLRARIPATAMHGFDGEIMRGILRKSIASVYPEYSTWCGSQWPLPNVHLGISAEDQERFAQRIGDLVMTPAALRWASFEPLLGPIDVRCLPDLITHQHGSGAALGWAVIGGESGKRARDCNVDHVRTLVGQLQEQGVRTFVKQLGAQPVYQDQNVGGPDPALRAMTLRDSHGGDPSEWPEDLRVREFPA